MDDLKLQPEQLRSAVMDAKEIDKNAYVPFEPWLEFVTWASSS